MDASRGLRAAILATLAAILLACTDPGAAPPDGAPSEPGPAAAPSLASPTTDSPVDATAAPSAPSGPDDYEY